MPARTLNDFFAGYFFIGIKADMEGEMVIASYKRQGKGGVKVINPFDSPV
jgi:hypothetical protein